jgi:hypothetical protein
VTNYEEAIEKRLASEELRKAEIEVRARLAEVAALIERLSAGASTS